MAAAGHIAPAQYLLGNSTVRARPANVHGALAALLVIKK
jgi:hypothetical protein